MDNQANLPRRALQRRGVRRKRATQHDGFRSRPKYPPPQSNSSADYVREQNTGATLPNDEVSTESATGRPAGQRQAAASLPRMARQSVSSTPSTPSGVDLGEDAPDKSSLCEEDILYEQFRTEGPTLANHCTKTLRAMAVEENQWIRQGPLRYVGCMVHQY